MKTYIILLRGVTPTGKNKIPMAKLRVELADAGLLDVRTYIQSGNVIARSHLGQSKIERLVHDVIEQKIGADITVMARTPIQIARILERNPFSSARSSQIYFSVLSSRPAPQLVGQLREIDFSPDYVKIDGTTIYTVYATKYSDSKFNNNYFERKLKVAATTRNFNTMSRLVELCRESSA